MDIKFKTLNELYMRLTPALRSKKKELDREGYKYIHEEDIWNYLKLNVWRTNTELTLDKMVDDILNTPNKEFDQFLKSEIEKNPEQAWDLEIFGKSLFDLVYEGLHNKLGKIPPEAQSKLQHTLERIINEGRGNLICIIL